MKCQWKFPTYLAMSCLLSRPGAVTLEAPAPVSLALTSAVESRLSRSVDTGEWRRDDMSSVWSVIGSWEGGDTLWEGGWSGWQHDAWYLLIHMCYLSFFKEMDVDCLGLLYNCFSRKHSLSLFRLNYLPYQPATQIWIECCSCLYWLWTFCQWWFGKDVWFLQFEILNETFLHSFGMLRVDQA